MSITQFSQALLAELLKIRRSRVLWITFAVFALAPLMGGMFMLILQYPESMPHAGMMKTKAAAMAMTADWSAMLLILSQSIGVGGVLVFGFVASWLFGREYSDGTAKDLLALPIPRSRILQAKFVVYALWCAALALSNLLLGLALGAALGLPAWSNAVFIEQGQIYAITTLLTVLVGMPIGAFALLGKGYLVPLGFVSLTLVLAQIIGAAGLGAYFPWAVPGLYSGAAGEYKAALNVASYGIVAATALGGYVVAIWYWNAADHVK